MGIRKHVVTVTTGTATGENFSSVLSGFLESIQYVKPGSNSFSDGVDFTVTLETTGQAVWAQSDVNASVTKLPRAATHTTAGVAAIYATDAPVNDRIAIGRERIKVAVAQGGNGTTGTFIITMSDD